MSKFEILVNNQRLLQDIFQVSTLNDIIIFCADYTHLIGSLGE